MSVLLLTMGPNLSIMADIPAVGVGNPGVIRFRPIGAIGPVSWTLVDSTLPGEWDSSFTPDGNGVTLSTADAETGGTFRVTVRAVDSSRTPVVQSYEVRVIALPLTITGSFPTWTVGVPATGSLTINGGTPPYSSLSISSGALPAGVSLSLAGNLITPTGTPTIAGPWSASVQVLDASATPASVVLSGDIQPPDMSPVRWTTPGSYTYTPWVSDLLVLLVAGGGGGGRGGSSNASGGGGGAGGVRKILMSVTPGVPLTVVVGAGGDPGVIGIQDAGSNGGLSSIGEEDVDGGGGGGYGSISSGVPGKDGGSGGGGGGNLGIAGTGIPGQGHDGGPGATGLQKGGGGGGAGEAGDGALSSSDGGSGVYHAEFTAWHSGWSGGGGGGGVSSVGSGVPGQGGIGGGGDGGNASPGVPGVDGTGGGGGGGGIGNSAGGRGGHGSVTVIPQ